MADNGAGSNYPDASQSQRKEIYTYKAPWPVFSLSWSRRCVFNRVPSDWCFWGSEIRIFDGCILCSYYFDIVIFFRSDPIPRLNSDWQSAHTSNNIPMLFPSSRRILLRTTMGPCTRPLNSTIPTPAQR